MKAYAKTMKKEVPLVERLDKIRSFHRYLQLCVFGGEEDIQPEQIFYIDELPVEFQGSKHRDRTLSMAGEPVFIAKAYGSADKRMASIVCTICAGSEQIVPLGVVLSGAGQVTEEELTEYELSPLKVFWQKKAWADTPLMLEWLEMFNESTQHIHDKYGFRILGTDQHGPRMTRLFTDRCAELGIVLVYGPASCTDVVAPVDHHVGVRLKEIIGRLYTSHLEANRRRWQLAEGRDGHFTASDRRMLLTQWAEVAWEELKENHANLLLQAFRSTGYFPLNPDGSEDDDIKIGKGHEDYRWR